MIQTRTVSQVLGAVMLTILILALTACGSGSAQEAAKARPLPLYEKALIRNPVVEYTYAKEDRVVASCDYRRVGEPLQESEGPRRTLAPSDRVAAERGDE